MQLKTARYHLIALFVVIVWGTTLVATKMLLYNGLSPRDIIFYRFLMAYICIWFLGQRKLFADNFKDEFLFMLLGTAGVSLYFMLANTALQFTQASNVALLACVAPIFTIIISRFLLKSERLNRYTWHGSLLAFVGVGFVVFNGQFTLNVSPLGDVLGLLSALSWAFYTILLKRLGDRYSTLFITRKAFFYGIIFLVPFFLHTPLNMNVETFKIPVVWGSLLFLGIMASLGCFFLWNTVVKKLGAVRAGNYIYLSPLVTMLVSVLVMDEVITVAAMIGTALILTGVVLAERK